MNCSPSSVGLMGLAIACAVISPCPVIAQVNTADLVISTSAGEDMPLGNVTITLRRSETGHRRSVTTAHNGQVAVRALQLGRWELGAVREGFRDVRDQAIVLRVGQTAHLHIIMRPVASDTVTVTGDIPIVDLYKTDVSTNILPEQIASLPVPDRQYEQLAFLAPAVQPDSTPFFGRGGAPVVGSAGSAWSNTYVVDGVDTTDPARGVPELRIGQDAIREFRVIAQGFDAEIALSPGGALVIVTKSGTNQLSGSVFGFYRADALRSQGALEEETADFSRYHAGFTFGGPIVRDRSHFFASFEHMDDENFALVRPGGAFVGLSVDVPHPTEQTLALLSLDHRFSESSSGLAKLGWERYAEENYQVGGVLAPSYGWTHDYDQLMLLLGHSWVVDDDRLNELRIQAGMGRVDTPLNSDERTEWFSFGSTLQRGANLNGNGTGDQRRFKLQDTFHWQGWSRHDLRTGLAYQHYRLTFTGDRFEHGLLMYATDDQSLPMMYLFGTGSAERTFTTDVFGLFVQDDWRVTDFLTLGLGLRYDLDLNGNNPDFEHQLVSGRGIDRDNLQPRFGFTWDVSGRGRTVVRGGVGLYTGRFLHFPPVWELQYNGETGRVLQSRISSLMFGDPRFPIDWQDPENTGILLAPDAVLLGDDLEAPNAVQANIGLSYRLGMSGLVLEADATWVEGRGELVYRDTNWAGNACVDDPMVSCRPIPDFTKIDRYTSEGHSRSKALTVGVSGTLHGGHLMNAAVIVSDKKSIMDDALTLHKPSDSADVEAEWGRSNTDERYRLVLSGVFFLPWDLTLAPIYEYGSGRPWTRLLGYDANGDGSVTDRPPDSERNDRDGPRFQQLSLRLTKAVPLGGGKGRLDLIVEAFNAFNTTNYDVNSVDNAMYLSPGEENPRFGTYTATLSPREIQLGLRYVF